MLKTQESVVIILGLPGSGKTTYGKLLARANDSIFIEEPYERLRKYLAMFYGNIENAAYDVQMGFFKAWKEIFEELSPNGRYVIDGGPLLAYSMYVKTLHQLNMLSNEELAQIDQFYFKDNYEIFNKFKDNYEFVHLNTSTKTVHNRILRRNRLEEQISESYLKELNFYLLKLVGNISSNKGYQFHDIDNERVLVECPPCEGKGFRFVPTTDETNNKPGPMHVIECANCDGLGSVFY